MDKNQREARRHQEDIALTRALLWIGAAVVLEGLLVLVNRFYINYYVSEVEIASLFLTALKAVRIGSIVLFAGALAWGCFQLTKGKKAVLPFILTIGGGALAICSHVILKYHANGMSMLFWLVIAWAVLAVVYYIYQKEFFLSACALGMSVLGLWFVRYTGGISYEVILLLIATALVLAAGLWLKKKDGVVPFHPPVQFLSPDCCYTVMLVSCGAALAALVAAMILGASAAYYLIFALLAWIFALFVYYTVKMM